MCVEASWRQSVFVHATRGRSRGREARQTMGSHTRAHLHARSRNEEDERRSPRVPRSAERSRGVETPRAREPDAHGEMRFSRRVRSRPRGFGSARRERTCETRAPRLKAADLPALTATGAVSEAMADMVAETWTRARGVAERALETRQLRVGARARVQVENGYVRKVGLKTLYEERKNSICE